MLNGTMTEADRTNGSHVRILAVQELALGKRAAVEVLPVAAREAATKVEPAIAKARDAAVATAAVGAEGATEAEEVDEVAVVTSTSQKMVLMLLQNRPGNLRLETGI